MHPESGLLMCRASVPDVQGGQVGAEDEVEAGAEGAAGRRCCTGLGSPLALSLALSLANSAFRCRAHRRFNRRSGLDEFPHVHFFSSTVLLSTFKP